MGFSNTSVVGVCALAGLAIYDYRPPRLGAFGQSRRARPLLLPRLDCLDLMINLVLLGFELQVYPLEGGRDFFECLDPARYGLVFLLSLGKHSGFVYGLLSWPPESVVDHGLVFLPRMLRHLARLDTFRR